ncbi:fused (3R)-hydroxyacyl-ACP dehydratase subunits HadA/HadB [Nocardia noduli]|uniref:fused (3R)-hydroxyacyl-ACP dehydratase subunits HadA/HadB n=1 Tax=Nocardia noduli TaxID=2815722 RepID=UPI0027DF3A74|nr:fused (3R)-hydroxyacyl-ACP dehydratase subunits HadA/HadB [Nocardia noduli]
MSASTTVTPAMTPSEQAAALVGRRYRMVDHYEVGREKIREFARAVRDEHPAHRDEGAAAALGYDGLIAPLTFPAILWITLQRMLFESVLTGYDLGQVLHTEQRIRMRRPLVAGDRLRCDSHVESFRRFGDKDFMVVENLLTDHYGETVQSAHTTVVAQTGATVAGELARAVDGVILSGGSSSDRRDARADIDPLSAAGLLEYHEQVDTDRLFALPPGRRSRSMPTFEDLAVGTELPPLRVRLTRGDLVNYAGVSGDANPIHFSDEVAQAAGLPAVISHGLLTMGLGAGYLTSWLGDPAAVTGYSVRFAGFVPVESDRHSTIEFGGRVKAIDVGRRSATIALTATCERRKLFGRATAEVLLR